jgi:hypothetical protein
VTSQLHFDNARPSPGDSQSQDVLLDSDGPVVARCLLRFLEKQPDRPEGVHVADVARHLEADADSIE